MCVYDRATVVCIHCNRKLDVLYKLKVHCMQPVCMDRQIKFDSVNSTDCGCTTSSGSAQTKRRMSDGGRTDSKKRRT